jgi:LmbE family N-acetylglucosaminyl deacetylase
MTRKPVWVLDVPELRALLVVAHADDETIFAGGLILSSQQTKWTILCVHPQGQQRQSEFLSACEFYEHESSSSISPVLFDPPLSPNDKIDNDWLVNALKPYRTRYDFVLTHNSEGEYGNENHRIVHRCVLKSIANPNTWIFISPGSTNVDQTPLLSQHPNGNVTLTLSPKIQKLKAMIFQECHKSQAVLYGYDPVSRKLRDSNLRATLEWEFESGKEQYTFYV